jgi:glutathione S-transferase
MADITLNVIKPSVNNLSARVFLRASGLGFTEKDVYGQTRTPEYLAACPAHLTPMIESAELPNGVLWESCAIMQYLSNKHGLDNLYPRDAERRAMIDSAMFYLIGTFYPYLARATYPALNFPQYPGEVGYSDADAPTKEKARQAAVEALAEPLDVFRSFYIKDKPFIGGDSPSIADIRLAATLESSTIRCRPGQRPMLRPWRNRWATPTPNQPTTCAATSVMSGRSARLGHSPRKQKNPGARPGLIWRASELVVQADLDGVDVEIALIGAKRNGIVQRHVAREVIELVLALHRPLVVQRMLHAAANRPAGQRLGST